MGSYRTRPSLATKRSDSAVAWDYQGHHIPVRIRSLSGEQITQTVTSCGQIQPMALDVSEEFVKLQFELWPKIGTRVPGISTVGELRSLLHLDDGDLTMAHELFL